MSQTLWQQWTSEIAAHVSTALGDEVAASEIVIPPDMKLGDFAFGCFKHAKKQETHPAALATHLAETLAKKASDLTFTAAGPYLNICLNAQEVIAQTVARVQKEAEQFGKFAPKSGQGQILVEYANPNTHKEIHIGHLRNFITGRVFVSLLQAAGESVVPVSYVNDLGANVAKTLWWMVREAKLDIRALELERVNALCAKISAEQKTGRYLGQLYTEATRFAEEQPDTAEDISYVQSQLEAHQPAYEELWRMTRDWCIDELRFIFKELDIQVEKMYLESNLIDRAQEVVDELEEKKVAVRSEGALIVNLEEEKLGVVLIRKSDGNLLYASKDLALAEDKMRDYPDLAKAYFVVDQRQNLYFRQLGRVLQLLGYNIPFEALCYELVTLKDGAMSSRKGNVVTYQGLRDAILAYAKEEIQKRHEHIDEQEKNKRAWDLALGGMIFAMLKQDPDKIFTFDMEQALAFEGATGPYCQYAVTRLASILRKAEGANPPNPPYQGGNGDSPLIRGAGGILEDEHAVAFAQKALALMIAQLPEKVSLAAKELRPSVIAQWCLDMAQSVNAFYRDVPVLSARGSLRDERLALVASAKTALSNGLHLLGIPTPEEM